MATNFLKYNNLTYDDIIIQITNKLKADSRFDNFRESAVAQTLIEIFAACTDLVNYNIERRAEECFMDTAKLRSSVILLAKQLGYVISRPVPASAKMYLKLKGDANLASKVTAGDLLQIPIYTKFTYNSKDLLLKTGFTYTFTTADVTAITTSGANYQKLIEVDDDSNDIWLIQGTQKTAIIDGQTNTQVSQKFQTYKIYDTSFSNFYGSEDLDVPLTKVYVGNIKSDDTLYDVDRRSLINWESIGNFIKGDEQKVCVIRTSTDENIELMFGDAQYAALGATLSASGPLTTYDNIYVDYLSTKGLEANQTGIIDQKINGSSSILLNGNVSKDVTSNVEFYFLSNLMGGADMEDIDSIRLNSPAIYYSLDRLVAKRDYIYYLKSLTSPIDIRNAIAWGEQEEYAGTTKEPILKLFNCVLVSCLGSLYNLDSDVHTVRTPDNGLEDAILDYNFDEDAIPQQSYFNLYIKENVVEQLKTYETSGFYFTANYIDPINDLTYVKDHYEGQILQIAAHPTSADYNYSNLIVTGTSAISVSATTSFDGIASNIQTALKGVSINSELAFENVSFTYNSTTNNFSMSSDSNTDDKYYIYAFQGNVGLSVPLGLDYNYNDQHASKVYYVNSDTVISDNIISVIDKLNERSQVTVRNVYISPIIQKFKLTGKIYAKQLIDKDTVHTSIKNDIYTWLDKNADFNVEINLSNIIDIIQSYPNIVKVDVKLESDDPVPPDGVSFYHISSDSRIDKYPAELATWRNPYLVIADELSNYLSGRTKLTESDIISLWGVATAKNQSLSWYRNINERTFFNVLLKNIYTRLTESTSTTSFRDSTDFLDVCSDIHKDLLPIIRYNMLDSNGNIAKEESAITTNGVDDSLYYRGGYTMGNEIAKISIETDCVYSKKQ